MTISLNADGSSASHIILIQRMSAFLSPLHHLQMGVGLGKGGGGGEEGEFTCFSGCSLSHSGVQGTQKLRSPFLRTKR